jgi:4-hydroxybenzoate polyprenyltransferase
MLGFLTGFGVQTGFPMMYYWGIGIIAAIFLYQHKYAYKLEGSGAEQRFTLSPSMMKMNGWVSVLYFGVVGATVWFSKGF